MRVADARGIAGTLEHLREGRGFEREPPALVQGVGDSVAELVPARVQRGTRRRTGRADVEVIEAPRFIMQAVEVGRLEDGLPWHDRSP